MAYAPSFLDLNRRAAGYVAKIVKGAKPADLPVEEPTKFELVINLKTAKALGLTISAVTAAAGGSSHPVMQRRRFIVGIGAMLAGPLAAAGVAALASPFAAFAQTQKLARIGFLGTGSAAGMAKWIEAFRTGLRELGYIEGKNLTIEYRWADGEYDKAPQLATELVRLKVDVLVTHGTPGTRAAKQATATIPIVMATAGDAVLVGLVSSIARPGGNVTGSTFFNPELAAKRLELLKEALPGLRRAAALTNPDNPAMGPVLEVMEPAARKLAIELQQFPVRAARDLQGAFAAMSAKHMEAAVIIEDGLLNAETRTIAEFALAKRLPIIGLSELAKAGAMMAYGVSFPEMYHRAAVLVDKILKGAKPGDLPIERPTRFEFTVNLKTARTLGITIPPSLVLRADQVIE